MTGLIAEFSIVTGLIAEVLLVVFFICKGLLKTKCNGRFAILVIDS